MTDAIIEMKTLRETSAVTGLSYDAIRKMCLRHEIAHIRAGKKILVNLNFLRAYLNRAGLEKKNDL